MADEDATTLQAGGPVAPRGTGSTAEASEGAARDEVMHVEEAARAAAFGRGVAILSGLGIVVWFLRSVPREGRLSLLGAMVTLGVIGTITWWRSRSARTYSRTLFRFFGIASAVAALVLVYGSGIFTPVVVIIVLGLAFFVQGQDTRAIYPVSIAVIVAYVVMAALVIAGVLPDRGIWYDRQTEQLVSMTVIVTGVMVTQLVLARANHRALADAIARSREAMRVVRTREAQLDEARENLHVALRGGNGGRLTGATIAGYRIGDVVGRGAMGEVYAARSERGQEVAIKVLRAHADVHIAKRFIREAEIARRVRGRHLVSVFETGQTPDGAIYIVMELLTGKDLAAILRDRTTLTLGEVVTLVEETANGLTALHDAGVVHRDLKPQNLFLSTEPKPVWKILDYGVSKLVDAGTLTENDLVGTPGYMSPEQARGDDVDRRSDVFSLGAVAYRALTGRRPFTGEDVPAILYQVVHGAPVRPREIDASIPRSVETVLAIALAKRPGERFETARELAVALRAASRGKLDPEWARRSASVARAWRSETASLAPVSPRGPRA